ncbi:MULTISPECIES: hypothetical protein [unclassified Sphingomonas]|uniref:hypothetical protein n=1 Tax=unclassified Sphingomonas TaxID=196159 RepID=UPI00226A7753|nr:MULTISPECIES: hypothetical protein [unclassified Sphingomonas]
MRVVKPTSQYSLTIHGSGSMEDRYTFSFDNALGILSITVNGFWDRAATDSFKREFAAAAAVRSPFMLKILVDRRASDVQSAETINAIQGLLSGLNPKTTKIAVVVNSSLQTLQVKRLGSDNRRTFATLEEARLWLIEKDR